MSIALWSAIVVLSLGVVAVIFSGQVKRTIGRNQLFVTEFFIFHIFWFFMLVFEWLLLFVYFAVFLRTRSLGCEGCTQFFIVVSVLSDAWQFSFCCSKSSVCVWVCSILGVVLSVTWGLDCIWVVTLALSVEPSLCRDSVSTGKVVVLSLVSTVAQLVLGMSLCSQ
jgi:hypothetical protein